MPVKDILLLGNPQLYEVSEPVIKAELESLEVVVGDLRDTMLEFRRVHGVGRAIAAPQIGVFKRLIYMNIEGTETVFINPELVGKSEEMFELWDDCMSFPDLLVKVKRHQHIIMSYYDLGWEKQVLRVENDLSELLQHEYDHLDGILATMRAIDPYSFSLKSQLGKTT